MIVYNGIRCVEGILFLKPRIKFAHSEEEYKELLEKQAYNAAMKARTFGINCNDALEDNDKSRDIGRDNMLELLDYLMTGKYKALVVEDIYDITTDLAELKNFIDKVQRSGIVILDLRGMTLRFNDYDEEC